MLNRNPFDPDRPDLKDIGVVEHDLRTIEAVRPALRTDVGEDAVHLLLGLAHRMALHDLADAPAGPPVRTRIRRIAGNHRTVQGIEAPDVIETGDMVHMRMREDDGIDLVDAVLDARKAHFGRRVDQERGVSGTHVSAASAAPVAWIHRGADPACAADLRNPDARPRP